MCTSLLGVVHRNNDDRYLLEQLTNRITLSMSSADSMLPIDQAGADRRAEKESMLDDGKVHSSKSTISLPLHRKSDPTTNREPNNVTSG